MKFLRVALVFALVNLVQSGVFAQHISKLIITDNLKSSGKFTVGKPKPAEPKDHFIIMPEKGTQVLCFTELTPEENGPETFQLRYTAYKIENGKDVWADDRVFEGKGTATYALVAFNFFEEGEYRIVITGMKDKNVLAEGRFVIGH